MASIKVKTLVVGAGPTGLGAGWRLHELGEEDWLLIDAAPEAGGLSYTHVDEKGFLWDIGGHVIFSHYQYFDEMLDHLLGDQWLHHMRESWVWMRQTFIPYPLQNNIWRLPPKDLIACIDGLVDATKAVPQGKPSDFLEWINRNFGKGLADVFMIPYNFKVWAHKAEDMDAQWMGERVALVDIKRVLRNVVLKQDDASWGPNATFRFPLFGGTGAIWKALFNKLPESKVRLNSRIVRVDSKEHRVTLADGTTIEYESMLSTVPADCLIRMMPDQPELLPWADKFKHSASHIIGIGMEGPLPEHLAGKCWFYFPEDDCPFYRATIFSNYSPNNVPQPGKQWSIMCEVSESTDKPVAGTKEQIIEDTIQGLKNTKFITDSDVIVTKFHVRLEYGYPTPFKGRDEVVDTVDAALRKVNIWSRGRFGAWRYEVANQDHSMMQGVEGIDNIILGAEETTYRHPGVVNFSKGTGRRPKFSPAGPSTVH